MTSQEVVHSVSETSSTINNSNDTANHAPRANKRKFQARGGPSNKKFSSNFKHHKTSILSGVPLKTYFQVYTSNIIDLYSDTFYDILVAADNYINKSLTKLQCRYVLTMAITNRMVQCGVKLGYSIPKGSELLRVASQHILLPDFLCKYVEAVGRVEMNGIQIVPYITDYQELVSYAEYFADPGSILQQAGRSIPDNIWKVDRSWITDYNIAIARVSRLRLGLRQILECTEGRHEMLIGYILYDELSIPIAPSNFTRSEFQLGACYKFRCYDQFRAWPGEDNYCLPRLFQSEMVDPKAFVASSMSESLVMRSYSAVH